jgi:hypothetical protein
MGCRYDVILGGCERYGRPRKNKRHRGEARKARAFGEMVSLRWRIDVAAAAQVEQLWNTVIEEHELALLCTYSLDGTDTHGTLPECLIGPHSHDLAASAN